MTLNHVPVTNQYRAMRVKEGFNIDTHGAQSHTLQAIHRLHV